MENIYREKIDLANLPTKIQELTNINKDLKGPDLYIKRDDEIGLALGGNKVRKLEYIMKDAINQGAEIIITSGGEQTNHGRLTSAAAIKLGLHPVLVITGEEPEEYKGNLLLNQLLNVELHFSTADPDSDSVGDNRKAGEEKVLEIYNQYKKDGRNAYIVPRGGRSSYGTLGYSSAIKEIKKQQEDMGIEFDYIVTSVGSSSTIGGLLIGKEIHGLNAKILGISVSRSREELKELILNQVKDFNSEFNKEIKLNEEEITIFDDYIGDGYAIPTELGQKAIEYLAQKESVFIDPVYTGKGMSGLLDLIKKKCFSKEDKILFIHTGGSPALFS